MNLIKPKSLKRGATITIIAPSGNVNTEKVYAGKKYFEDRGYNIKLGKNIFNQNGYLSGTDEERLEDLHNAFLDAETDAIICARGGYGALRLIDKIDYNLIKNNPKIFCGYSDITILNHLILKNAGLITFSGPMIQGDFAQDEINKYTENEFFNTLTSNNITLSTNYYKNYFDKNSAQGLLIGGNLSTFSSLCGTDFLPNDKFIFFAEDLNEPVYKIDRYFTQLMNIPDFRNNVTAILLGDFIGIENEYQKDFDNLFYLIAQKLNIPVIKEYPFSHSKTKATVPYGAYAQLSDGKIFIKDYLI